MHYDELQDFIRLYKSTLVVVGDALAQAKNEYRNMVGEINTWGEFLTQPEVGLSTREANGLIALADWVEAMDVPVTDLNLSTARLCASRGISDASLLPDIRTLSTKDFKERYHDVLVGEDNATRTYTYMMMKRCDQTGNLYRVYDDEAAMHDVSNTE